MPDESQSGPAAKPGDLASVIARLPIVEVAPHGVIARDDFLAQLSGQPSDAPGVIIAHAGRLWGVLDHTPGRLDEDGEPTAMVLGCVSLADPAVGTGTGTGRPSHCTITVDCAD